MAVIQKLGVSLGCLKCMVCGKVGHGPMYLYALRDETGLRMVGNLVNVCFSCHLDVGEVPDAGFVL